MEYALALVLLAALVALAVTGPLRSGEEPPAFEAERRGELEAAKEAKYREIRDAELDFRTGKLSEADFRATDRELRGQAIDILRELDGLAESPPASGPDEVSGAPEAPPPDEPPRFDEAPTPGPPPPAGERGSRDNRSTG